MQKYQVKNGVELPKKKYIPGYGLVTLTSDMSDAQVEAIIATGHCQFFEKVETTTPETKQAEENQTTEQTKAIVPPSPIKKHGKAKQQSNHHS